MILTAVCRCKCSIVKGTHKKFSVNPEASITDHSLRSFPPPRLGYTAPSNG
jgi:hypothetical protein